MFINIQFLRAIAALLVVFYHTADHFFVVGGAHSGNIFSLLSHIGYIGVDIFFVISGFIMWITTQKLQGLLGASKFAYARATRIYLVYWFFLAFMIYYYHHSLSNFDLIGSIFLTVSSSSKLLLQVAWTLQFELYFYLLFALLLFLPKAHRIKVLIALFAVIILLQIYASYFLDIYNKNIFNEASTFWTFWSSPYILEFLMGSFIGYFYETKRIKYLMPLYVGVILLIASGLYYQSHYIDGTLADGYYLRERVLFLGLASALLLAIAVEWEKRSKQIVPKFSLLVGGASYSIYLSHTIILLFIYEIGLRDWIGKVGQYQLWFMLGIVLLIVVYSVMHYKWVESPIMRWSHRFGKRIFNKFGYAP